MRTARFSFVLSSLLVVSCAEAPTHTASSDVFLEVLRNTYSGQKVCARIGTRPRNGVIAQAPSILPDPRMEMLVAAGLLTREQDGISLKYALTDAIMPLLEGQEPGESYSGGIPRLCFAEVRILDLLEFTEPTETFGTTVSNVRYSEGLVNVEPWAEDVFADTNDLPQIQGGIRERTTDLILTPDGWVVQSSLQP
ncbi:MAG: hypothetical protein WBG08_11435 [Litorimonas sp.]